MTTALKLSTGEERTGLRKSRCPVKKKSKGQEREKKRREQTRAHLHHVIRANWISGVSSNTQIVSFQIDISRCEFRAKRNSYSFHPGQCIVRGSQRKTYSCHCTTPEARYPWEYLYRLGRIYSTYSKQKKTQLSNR